MKYCLIHLMKKIITMKNDILENEKLNEDIIDNNEIIKDNNEQNNIKKEEERNDYNHNRDNQKCEIQKKIVDNCNKKTLIQSDGNNIDPFSIRIRDTNIKMDKKVKNKNKLFQNYQYQAVIDEANQILQNKFLKNNGRRVSAG